MATDDSASAASEIEVGSIYPTMEELRAGRREAGRYIHVLLVSSVEWCGMWRVEVSPYHGGIRTAGIGWSYGGSLIG